MCDELYAECRQCPRKCGTDRRRSRGFCTQNDRLYAASACLHFGEEPLITVFGGSGTIFFTGCTLKCAFCQNYQISQQGMGAEVNRSTFVDMCLKLEEKGAENINLVTPSHHVPVIAEYIAAAKKAGVKIPFAWNSSAYESPEMLDMVKGLVDIYLPDLKTLNPIMSRELFAAEDYPQAAKKAIRRMIENAPLNIEEINKNGETKEKMLSGVIIRHLVLPGRMDDTRLVLDWLKAHADSKACISLMNQYTPVPFTGSSGELEKRRKALEAFSDRLVSKEEDKTLQQWIDSYEFEYLFYQELSDDTSWLPDFSRTQPFSNALARPVWHWDRGFINE